MKKFYLIVLLLLLNSCVSTKKYKVLQDQVNKLEQGQAELLTDNDDDGIIDKLDKEPDTPKGAEVDKDGVTLDSDKDGMPNHLDKEPFSPVGYKIDPATGVSIKPKMPKVLTDADIINIGKSQGWDKKPTSGSSTASIGRPPLMELPLPNSTRNKAVWGKKSNIIQNAKTIGDLDESLEMKLQEGGFDYGKYQYYRFERPGQMGYVVVTNFEKINTDGIPVQNEERWNERFSFERLSYWENLWNKFDPSYKGQYDTFRFFVFFVIQSTNNDTSGLTSGNNAYQSINHLPTNGDTDNSLPLDLKDRAINNDVQLITYVYEFVEQQNSSSKEKLAAGNNIINVKTTQEHLKKAGIIIK